MFIRLMVLNLDFEWNEEAIRYWFYIATIFFIFECTLYNILYTLFRVKGVE